MPEGPSIMILREMLEPFEGKIVREASGNAKIDMPRMKGKRLDMVLNWGKHLLLCFDDFYLRIHFLMFGTYRINERKDTPPRLSLVFPDGEVNFYTCSVRLLEGNPVSTYEWHADVLSETWDPSVALKRLRELPGSVLVSDALLNQEIFAGVGNIIKNEVLWRIKVHPESRVTALSLPRLKELVKDAREYSQLFYEWKKEFVLKKNWKIYKKSMCPRCDLKTIRAYIGRIPRLTCYCSNCQELWT